MPDLVILGAGGGAKSVLWLLETINDVRRTWNLLGLIDDNPALHGTLYGDLPVLGGFDWFDDHRALVIHGVGSPSTRRRFAAGPATGTSSLRRRSPRTCAIRGSSASGKGASWRRAAF